MNKIITRILIISIFIALLIHCSDRKRENPLDPQNPATGGKPQGLSIFSQFDIITISWDYISNKNIQGYNIYRKQNSDSLFRNLAITSTNTDYYIDDDVTYGNKYTYRISALTKRYESPLSDSISIIPGPIILWVADAYNYNIVKLSDDCIHQIANISTTGYPWAITIDPDNGSYWYSDLLLGKIYHTTNNETTVYSAYNQWWQPVSMVLESDNNTLWAADMSGQLIRIKPYMSSPIVEIKNENIEEPTSIAVDNQRNICWAADPESNKVFRFSSSDTTAITLNITFQNPIAVAIENSSGSCFVADSTTIVKLNNDGTFNSTLGSGLNDAHLLEVNQNTHEIWIIDWGSAENDSKLIKYNQTGTKIFEKENFNYPRCIKVNLSDNGCIVADSRNRRVVEISAQGEIMSENNNFYYPVGLDIEYARDIN